jgi:hypothetical protein
MADEALGHDADQDLASPGCLLEPLRRVDGVARGERRRMVSRHDLAGVDPDSDSKGRNASSSEGGVQPVDGFLHVERSSHRPQRIVLVRAREAEHGHHRVADELLHGAAMPLDGHPHLLVPPAQELA